MRVELEAYAAELAARRMSPALHAEREQLLERVQHLARSLDEEALRQADLLEAPLARTGQLARRLMREHVLDFQRETLAAFRRA